MKGQRKGLVLLTGLCIFSFASSIKAGVMSIPYGWYLEANLGNSRISGVNFSGQTSSGSKWGTNLNLGYKFMPFFAGEIGFTGYSSSNIKAGTPAITIATIKHYSYDLAGKAIFPISDSGVEAFAKLGISNVTLQVSINHTNANKLGITGLSGSRQSRVGLYWGGGLQYYFMPDLAVVVQWAQAQGNGSTGTASLLSLGLNFIFA